MPGNGILIIDDSISDYARRRGQLMGEMDGDFQFIHSLSVNDGLKIIREHRDNLCAIILDQKLTSDNDDLSTTQIDRLRQLEATIQETMHPKTVLCISVDDANGTMSEVKRQLGRAKVVDATHRPVMPTHIFDERSTNSIKYQAEVIAASQAIASGGNTKAIEALQDEIKRIQSVLWFSGNGSGEFSICDSIRQHDRLLASASKERDEIRKSLAALRKQSTTLYTKISELSDRSQFRNKMLEAFLSGPLGRGVSIVFGLAVLFILGVDIAELLSLIIERLAGG